MSLIFTSEIQSDSVYSKNLKEFIPLLYTSNSSASMTSFYNLNPDPKANPSFNKLNESSKVIGARVVVTEQNSSDESNITLVSDSKLFADQGGSASQENMIFIMNSIDFMLGDKELISLRSREVTDRPLITESDNVSNQVKLTWKVINMLMPAITIILMGIYVMRRKKKESIYLEALYE